MKRYLHIFVCVFLIAGCCIFPIFAVGCASGQDNIVGYWIQDADDGFDYQIDNIEFYDDGSFFTYDDEEKKDIDYDGSYKLSDDGRVILSAKSGLSTTTIICGCSVSGDTLTLTDSNDGTATFKKG